MRSITLSRVARCLTCLVVATRCLWAAHHQETSLSSMVSDLYNPDLALKTNIYQTHVLLAVLPDTTPSASSAIHDHSPGRISRTSMLASDINHRVALMRRSKYCRQREEWRHSVRESCATIIRSSSTIEVGHPLLYLLSLLHNTHFKTLYPTLPHTILFIPPPCPEVLRDLQILHKKHLSTIHPHLLTRIRRCS